jgi:hypothetical protein
MGRGKSYFLQGQQGGDVLDSANADTAIRFEGYRSFLAIEDADCTFYDGRKPNGDPLDGLGGSSLVVTVPAGQVIECQFTEVIVTAGSGIAYYD